MSHEEKDEHFKFGDEIKIIKFNDVADKFRAYRQNAETTGIKLKEANDVIDQLKNEINISKDVETNLRNQIKSSQNRLLQAQKTVAKLLTISETVCQNEKTSLEVERKINEIEEVIQKEKQESQNLFKLISNEVDLLKKYEEVKLNLKNKETENNLLKIENQTLFKQKEELETRDENKCKILEHELEALRQENTEMQAKFDQILKVYQKQIADHELAINEYERERKSLLEEFAMPKSSEMSSDVTWADSTVTLTSDDRSVDECFGGNQTFRDSQGSRLSTTKSKPVIFKPKKSSKQKPQLEFLSFTQKPPSDAPPPKRRLFSMNCNHYAN